MLECLDAAASEQAPILSCQKGFLNISPFKEFTHEVGALKIASGCVKQSVSKVGMYFASGNTTQLQRLQHNTYHNEHSTLDRVTVTSVELVFTLAQHRDGNCTISNVASSKRTSPTTQL